MKKVCQPEAVSSVISSWFSWSYIDRDIAGDFAGLQNGKSLERNGDFPVIWDTKQKYVLKVAAPSGKVFAFKKYDHLKNAYKFFFRCSPCGAEAVNFQRISSLDIPMPKLLAAGDIRRNFVLKSAFIATEFAEDFRDGRDFYGKGKLAADQLLRDEFIQRNMELLARCHDNNILHRGFTPANLLYRQRSAPDSNGNMLNLMWIDVASCRKVMRFYLKRAFIIDFEQFFRFFDFSDQELAKFIGCYLQAAEKPLASAPAIVKKLRAALEKRRRRK